MYKVVEDQQGKTVFAGVSSEKKKAKGISVLAAEVDAKRRNDQAEELGIKTRYQVKEF